MKTPKKNKPARATTRTPPAFVTPMAAQLVTRLPEGDDWIYEIKFDGYRAVIIKNGRHVELRSRRNKNLAGMYPGVADAASRLNIERAVVDGEIVALDARGRPSSRRCSINRHTPLIRSSSAPSIFCTSTARTSPCGRW